MIKQSNIVERLSTLVTLSRDILNMTRAFLQQDGSGRIDTIDQLLKDRADLLDRFRTIEQSLPKRTDGGKTYLVDVSGEETHRTDELLDELHEVIRDIVDADHQLRSALEGLQSGVKEEMDRTRVGHTTLKAYRPFRYRAKMIIDRRE
jgi:hypothetical protein